MIAVHLVAGFVVGYVFASRRASDAARLIVAFVVVFAAALLDGWERTR